MNHRLNLDSNGVNYGKIRPPSNLTDSKAHVDYGLRARFFIVLVFISTVFFARFAINIGTSAISISLLALYVALIGLYLHNVIVVDVKMLTAYGFTILVALLSFTITINSPRASRTSLPSVLLLVAVYFPVIFQARNEKISDVFRAWAHNTFVSLILVTAFAGIGQFYLQYIYNPSWLFDFKDFIPEFIRASGGYNTVIKVGNLFKSNGFFFREPSGFSFALALGIVLEIYSKKRFWVLGILGWALLLSYSGTGLLALSIAYLSSLRLRGIFRAAAVAFLFSIAAYLLWEPLGLEFTVRRIDEFAIPGTSAYIRYVEPFQTVASSFASGAIQTTVGNGPGSILRAFVNTNIFDPTWAKLLYEYGVLGFFVISFMMFFSIFRSALEQPVKFILATGWFISGGSLLSPDYVSNMVMLSSLWLMSSQTEKLTVTQS